MTPCYTPDGPVRGWNRHVWENWARATLNAARHWFPQATAWTIGVDAMGRMLALSAQGHRFRLERAPLAKGHGLLP